MPMTFTVFEPERRPTRMQELSEGERLVVWSYRRWVVGMQTHEEGHWIRVWRELGCVLGTESARATLGGLQRMIREVAMHARRPVRLHPPCCGMICADELSLVALIAACQRRDHQQARRLAEWLVRAEGVGDLIEAGRIVADAMAGQRQLLPDRTAADRGVPDWADPEGPASGGASDGVANDHEAESAASAKDRL